MGENRSGQGESRSDWPQHNDVSGLLHVYAHALLSGEDAALRYPQVARHLSRCDVCATDMSEILAATRAAPLPARAPVVVPRPDLSWLKQRRRGSGQNGRAWAIDAAGTIWLEFTAALLDSWRPSALLGAARGELLYRYSYPAGPSEPGLDLEVYAEPGGAMTTLLVQVTLPEAEALSQSSSTVTLYVNGQPRQQATDSSGTTRFSGVPRASLDQLDLEITAARSA